MHSARALAFLTSYEWPPVLCREGVWLVCNDRPNLSTTVLFYYLHQPHLTSRMTWFLSQCRLSLEMSSDQSSPDIAFIIS